MGDRIFVVIPAAGHSRRMGRPKLLLPLGDKTVLERLLGALDLPGIAARLVVVRKDDDSLASLASAAGAKLVRPNVDPPEMRSSVEHALRALQRDFAPASDDGWMLVPADHPVLDRGVVERLLTAWRDSGAEILVPTCGGRRGHPTLFRWRLAKDVFALPADAGLNRLLRDRAADVREVPIDDPALLIDLDTPEEYDALRRRFTMPSA